DRALRRAQAPHRAHPPGIRRDRDRLRPAPVAAVRRVVHGVGNAVAALHLDRTLTMYKRIATLLASCLLVVACSPGVQAGPAGDTGRATAARPLAPEFTGNDNWINSEPLEMARLRGQVVLVEFWTYSCINCIRVMPYVKQWH